MKLLFLIITSLLIANKDDECLQCLQMLQPYHVIGSSCCHQNQEPSLHTPEDQPSTYKNTNKNIKQPLIYATIHMQPLIYTIRLQFQQKQIICSSCIPQKKQRMNFTYQPKLKPAPHCRISTRLNLSWSLNEHTCCKVHIWFNMLHCTHTSKRRMNPFWPARTIPIYLLRKFGFLRFQQ